MKIHKVTNCTSLSRYNSPRCHSSVGGNDIKGNRNRPLSKLAYAQGCEGDASPRTAAYSNVREDSSTNVAYKSPAEVEFRKRSNDIKGSRNNTLGLLYLLKTCPLGKVIKIFIQCCLVLFSSKVFAGFGDPCPSATFAVDDYLRQNTAYGHLLYSIDITGTPNGVMQLTHNLNSVSKIKMVVL